MFSMASTATSAAHQTPLPLRSLPHPPSTSPALRPSPATTTIPHRLNLPASSPSSPSPKKKTGGFADPDDLASALELCTAALSLRGAAQIHARILRLGLSDDFYLSSQLLRLYASCGDLATARSVLDAAAASDHRLLNHSFCYNVLIRAYANAALHEAALELFGQMLESGLAPNEHTFPFVLKSCSALGLLGLGRELHTLLVKTGLFDSNIFSSSALLDLYSKWGCLGDACKLFGRIPNRNVVSWNAIIAAYAQNGYWVEALEMLESMEQGQEVQVSSWNSVIAGCVRREDAESALETLGMMILSWERPSPATFNTLLPIIPTLAPSSRVKELHGFAMRHGGVTDMEFIDDERLRSAIASGYAYHGCMAYASHLFDRISVRTFQLWLSMMSGFVDIGKKHKAFDVFRDVAVQCSNERRTLSKVCLTLLLPECSPSSRSGLEIHAYACRHGLESNTSVSNALISMYTRRGDVQSSEQVFQRTSEKDIITWNAMVAGYAFFLDFDRAFELFCRMLSEGVRPDEYSFGSILNGCGYLPSLRQGVALHGHIIKSGFLQSYCVIQNALVDMYGKCGCLENARKLFDEMESRDSVSWNTIISCYGFNACPQEAFSVFDKMLEQGWKPNRVTFIGLLSGCSHAGLLDDGLHYFEAMSREHGIVPDVDHYTCIVDSLSRAGQLDRAFQLIESMPVEPDDCIWGALLGGCRIHGNVELAEVAAKHLIELEPNHSGYKVLLSNIYADACRWSDVARIRGTMRVDGLKKCPGYSWIEIGGGELHRFFRADKSHEQCPNIYSALYGLTKQLRDEGYVPIIDTKLFSFDETN